MYQAILNSVKPELDKIVSFFEKELLKLRTGQASPALVEDVQVDLFGSAMLLKQAAAISTSDRRQIVVQPWDKSYLGPIEKALQKSQLGASPVVDKDCIRISLPPLTQEYRKMLQKLLSEKAEETKQSLRKQREQVWSEIQEKTRKGEIREDDKFKGKEDLQKLIDEYSKKVDEAVVRKEREMEV